MDDVMKKLASLSGMDPDIPIDMAEPTEPVADPLFEQSAPMPSQDEAIENAAQEASAIAGDLTEDKPMDSMPAVPPVVSPDVLVQGDNVNKSGIPPQREVAELDELYGEQERIASVLNEHMVEFAALSQLGDLMRHPDDTIQKQANELMHSMMQDEQSYADGIHKIASSVFSTQEDLDMLQDPEAIEYIMESLAAFSEDTMEKVASEIDPESAGDGILSKTKSAVDSFVDSFKRLRGINEEIVSLRGKLDEAQAIHSQVSVANLPMSESTGSLENLFDAKHNLANAEDFRIKGYGAAALGAGALAGGAYLTGRALANRQSPQTSLNGEHADGTLESGFTNYDSENGGNYKMAHQQTFDNLLKIAGAGLLLSLTNNEAVDMELRKEASDQFDAISSLGRQELEVGFIQTALENYSDEQLREIVAGVHTEELLEKVAGFVAIDNYSADELFKVAGAGSVSAKGAAGALRDASEQVKNEIADFKTRAEGAGRQYSGDINEAGKVGGGLVNDRGGYNVIQNPAAYEVEQTASASDIENAVLVKQASYDAYMEADAFLQRYLGK